MIENLTYSYATTLEERINGWKELPFQETNQYVEEWQARNSLLTESDYSKLFHHYQIDKRTFGLGLLPFTEERAELLLPIIQTSPWFQLHQKLFTQEVPLGEKNLKAALRFHLNYYEQKLHEFVENEQAVILEDAVIKELVVQLEEELFLIAQKTLAWDVHQMIEEYQLKADSKEAEFDKYIQEFLGDSQRTNLFYGEYPTLARILSVRLSFACENIQFFLVALQQSSKELEEKFQLTAPFKIEQIVLGKGDSHLRGKTVIQFRIAETNLIFKYKNLEIGEKFNSFLAYVETLVKNSSFYKIKRIIQPEYTIEEMVPYTPCSNETEIEHFYQNYGYLLAIVYWLGATDLHMENLIAYGENPVLIDVETLIRPKLFLPSDNVSKQIKLEQQSVIVSGLLPQKRQWKREINADALSGKKQKVPFQVRRLKNEGSSDVAFQLEEIYLDDAQNIPILAGEQVDYQAYHLFIEKGFKDMNASLLMNKEEVIVKTKEYFEDTTVRLIYRDTQEYSTFLGFGMHTDCMSNYIEREKIMENLWASKTIPKAVIPLEVQAMLDNDIPLFTANASSTSVQVGDIVLSGLLESSPLEATIKHMEQITEQTSHFSYLLLKESLGSLQYSSQNITIPNRNSKVESLYLQKAADIADMIIEQLVINEENEILWANVLPEEGAAIIGYPSNDLYGGIGGLYLFLISLNQFVPKETYQRIINYLETELFHNKMDQEVYPSAFFSAGMRLMTAFYHFRLNQKTKYRIYMNQSLEELTVQFAKENETANEWLYGKASLVALLATVHDDMPEDQVKTLLKDYSLSIDCQEMDSAGFAHGYAGVLYSLIQANEILLDHRLEEKINWYKEKLIACVEANGVPNDSWCKGRIGIRKAYEAAGIPFTDSLNHEIKEIQDDCLCHGNVGNKKDYFNNISSLVKLNIKLVGDGANLPIGFFNGASGIGYQLVRKIAPNKIKQALYIL